MSDRGPEDDRDEDYSPARYRLPSLEEDEPRQLWRPILLALVVTVLFAGMIWFAYSRGVQEGAERVPPRIAAAEGPVKVRPQDPGGLDVPHQDKLVYDQMGGGAEREGEAIEELLPGPEEPLARPEPAPLPPLGQAAPAPDMVPPANEIPPPALGTAPGTSPDQDLAQGAGQPAAAVPAEAPAQETAEEDEIVEIEVGEDGVPTTIAPPPEAADRPAPEPTPQVALAPPPPAALTPPAMTQGGGAFVQLAAFRDEGGARKAWERIVAEHPDLFADRSLVLVQADVGGTTYYRVRTGPFPSRAAAAEFCAKLKRQGQDCIPAGS